MYVLANSMEVVTESLTVPTYTGESGTMADPVEIISFGINEIFNSVGDVFELVESILTTIVQNEVLCFLFAAGFVSVGIMVFGKLKKVVKK